MIVDEANGVDFTVVHDGIEVLDGAMVSDFGGFTGGGRAAEDGAVVFDDGADVVDYNEFVGDPSFVVDGALVTQSCKLYNPQCYFRINCQGTPGLNSKILLYSTYWMML